MNILAKPKFVKIYKNTLVVFDTKITALEAQTLTNYMIATKDDPDKIVHHLILDHCGLTDDVFEIILKGISAQGTSLQTLHYSNGNIGQKSLKYLLKHVPTMTEFSLNCPNNWDISKDVMRKLTNAFYI